MTEKGNEDYRAVHCRDCGQQMKIEFKHVGGLCDLLAGRGYFMRVDCKCRTEEFRFTLDDVDSPLMLSRKSIEDEILTVFDTLADTKIPEGQAMDTMFNMVFRLGAVQGLLRASGEADEIGTLEQANQNIGEKYGKCLFH